MILLSLYYAKYLLSFPESLDHEYSIGFILQAEQTRNINLIMAKFKNQSARIVSK